MWGPFILSLPPSLFSCHCPRPFSLTSGPHPPFSLSLPFLPLCARARLPLSSLLLHPLRQLFFSVFHRALVIPTSPPLAPTAPVFSRASLLSLFNRHALVAILAPSPSRHSYHDALRTPIARPCRRPHRAMCPSQCLCSGHYWPFLPVPLPISPISFLLCPSDDRHLLLADSAAPAIYSTNQQHYSVPLLPFYPLSNLSGFLWTGARALPFFSIVSPPLDSLEQKHHQAATKLSQVKSHRPLLVVVSRKPSTIARGRKSEAIDHRSWS